MTNTQKIIKGNLVSSLSDKAFSSTLLLDGASVNRYEFVQNYGPILGSKIAYSDILSDDAFVKAKVYALNSIQYSDFKSKFDTLSEDLRNEFSNSIPIVKVKVGFDHGENFEYHYKEIKTSDDEFPTALAPAFIADLVDIRVKEIVDNEVLSVDLNALLSNGFTLSSVQGNSYLPPVNNSKGMFFYGKCKLKVKKVNNSYNKNFDFLFEFKRSDSRKTSIFELINKIKDVRLKWLCYIFLTSILNECNDTNIGTSRFLSWHSGNSEEQMEQVVTTTKVINFEDSSFFSTDTIYSKLIRDQFTTIRSPDLQNERLVTYNPEQPGLSNAANQKLASEVRNNFSNSVDVINFLINKYRNIATTNKTRPTLEQFATKQVITDWGAGRYKYDQEGEYIEGTDYGFYVSVEELSSNNSRLIDYKWSNYDSSLEKIKSGLGSGKFLNIVINKSFVTRLFNYLNDNNYATSTTTSTTSEHQVIVGFQRFPLGNVIDDSVIFSWYGWYYLLLVSDDDHKLFEKAGIKIIPSTDVKFDHSKTFIDNFINIRYEEDAIITSVGVHGVFSSSRRTPEAPLLLTSSNASVFSNNNLFFIRGRPSDINGRLLTILDNEELNFKVVASDSASSKKYSLSFSGLLDQVEIISNKLDVIDGNQASISLSDFKLKDLYSSNTTKKIILDVDKDRALLFEKLVEDEEFKEDIEDSFDFFDEMTIDNNLIDLIISNLADDILIDDELVTNNIAKIMAYENMSDEQLNYLSSSEFASDWSVGESTAQLLNVEDFQEQLFSRVDIIDGIAIDLFSQIVGSTINEFKKMASSYSSLLSMNDSNSVEQFKQTEVFNDVFITVNNQIDNFDNFDNSPNDKMNANKRLISKFKQLSVKFDTSLGDPFLTLMVWKNQVLGKLALFEFNNPKVKRTGFFRKLLNKISLPKIDFSKIGSLIEDLFSQAVKLVPAIAARAVKALAIFDNIVNIIETIRFPFKVLAPKICLNYDDPNYRWIILAIPPTLIPNRALIKDGSYSFMSEFTDGVFRGTNSYHCKIFVPEINMFTNAIVVKMLNDNVANYVDFAAKVIKDNHLSEMSKFFSLLYGIEHQVDPELTHSENLIIAGLITAQAVASAASAFASGGTLLGRAIGAALATATVVAANAVEAAKYSNSRTISLSSTLVKVPEEDSKLVDFIENETVLVTPISTLTSVPVTPAFLAGKVMLQVLAIAGGFAAAVVVGKTVGGIVHKTTNSLKLMNKKRELKKDRRQLNREAKQELINYKSNVENELKNRKDYDKLSENDKKKISKNLIAQKKLEIKEKFDRKQGGLRNFSNAQIVGAAKYQLYLDDNGFNSGGLSKIINTSKDIAKKVGSKAVAAIGLTASVSALIPDKLSNKIKSSIGLSDKKTENSSNDDELTIGLI